MNILIEATFLKFEFITGIERHFLLQLEIIDNAKRFDKIFVVTTRNIPNELIQIETPFEVITIDSNSKESWEEIYKTYHFDILYSTFEPPELLPNNSIPVLYVLHDSGRYLFPDMMEKGVLDKHISNFEKYIQRENFYIITVSESSKKDIAKLFPNVAKKIFVVYNFISNHLLENKTAPTPPVGELEPNKFYLMIGRYMPTKNTLIVVKAFQNRSSFFENYSLVILGRKGWYDEFDKFVENTHDENIKLYDFISDESLTWLYQNCYALVNASLYEGFGLPLIEAAAFDCKRIMCSDIPVFREILPKATVFFDPSNQSQIEKVLFNEQCEERSFSKEVKTNFSLDKSTSQLLNTFNQIMPHE
jgi:glycosyltransferase involved in cell wall biosynthesis